MLVPLCQATRHYIPEDHNVIFISVRTSNLIHYSRSQNHNLPYDAGLLTTTQQYSVLLQNWSGHTKKLLWKAVEEFKDSKEDASYVGKRRITNIILLSRNVM